MDPTYVRDKPGKSPMGMDLVPVCPAEGATPAAGGVKIDSEMIQNMGVREAVVERRDLTRVVRAVGLVDYDERLVEHVHTKIQGWVEKLYVEYEGEMVKKGQPMLEIYSPQLVSTQEELLIAARYRDETSKSPFPDVKRGGEELFKATRRRLELWDIPDRDINAVLKNGKTRKTVTLYAPASGVVMMLMVRNGKEVSPNENLYTIADLSRVWVYANVYEYESAWVKEGASAKVDLASLPGKTLEAKVTYVYPFLDPKTRTVRVRLELDNPGLLLKPEMFANVSIEAEKQTGVLVVPEEAVIRSGRRNLVIVALGGGRFAPRDVTLGFDSGDGWLEIKDGLTEGERVVISGQFLIDSESKLQEAVQEFLNSDSKEGDKHEGVNVPSGAQKEMDMPGEVSEGMKKPAMDHEMNADASGSKE